VDNLISSADLNMARFDVFPLPALGLWMSGGAGGFWGNGPNAAYSVRVNFAGMNCRHLSPTD
jgi:hypothetical protein